MTYRCSPASPTLRYLAVTLMAAAQLLACGPARAATPDGADAAQPPAADTAPTPVAADRDRGAPDPGDSRLASLLAAAIPADPTLADALAAVPVGAAVTIPGADAAAAARLLGVGFVPDRDAPDSFVREVDLEPAAALAPTAVAALPGIDAIAVVSVDRGDQTPTYLYTTLRSLFAELPAGVVVNVMVGNGALAYVAPARLRAELGAWADQVVVHPSNPAQVAYLAQHFGVHARATWNHSRAMRAYRGTRGLLFLEDDVVFAQGMVPTLDQWLAAPSPPVLSLYNFFCRYLPGSAADPLHTVDLVTFPANVLPWTFSRTQAMVYRAEMARALGQTMSTRLTQAPADALVDWFMRAHDLDFGFAQPSMVQHIGRHTTGLGRFQESSCYAAAYPPLP